MTFSYFWRFLLYLLTISFIIIKKIKGIFKLALNMLFNRQKRAKLLKSFIISEDQILARLQKLPKLPQQIVLCLSVQQKSKDKQKERIQQIMNWTERLQIPKTKIYSLEHNQVFESIESTNLELQTFSSFYSKFVKQVNDQKYQRQQNLCPLILVFNSILYMNGLPFSHAKGGEILLCGQLQTFSLIDFQDCLKKFAKTEQRLGK